MRLSRRNFLKAAGATALSIPFLGHSNNIFALTSGQKIFVLIELNGGNDGLNTVVPFKDAAYYSARPTMAVAADKVLPISDTLGFHPEMTTLMDFWNSGKIAIVQGVGYPDPDLSHFRSTDIWRGANTAPVIDTGWIGRYLQTAFPSEIQNQTFPLSVEVQNSNTLLTSTGESYLGLATTNPTSLYNNIKETVVLPKNTAPTGLTASEFDFVFGAKEQAKNLAKIVNDINNAQKNSITYPTTGLGSQLSMVARLISGGLQTNVYNLALGGFDTHSNQLTTQLTLLKTLAEASSTFLKDIETLGHSDKVVVLIASEFGRRVKENGSGTDHGTAQPVFVMGNINPGLYGTMPSLTDLDSSGNMKFTTDFRGLYATVLTKCFGVSQTVSDQILLGSFAPIGFLS
jgi:uncharacterized protein (DUF1501 family)